MLMEKHLDTTGTQTVKQETVVKYFKKHEISNACGHTEDLVPEETDTTAASDSSDYFMEVYNTYKTSYCTTISLRKYL